MCNEDDACQGEHETENPVQSALSKPRDSRNPLDRLHKSASSLTFEDLRKIIERYNVGLLEYWNVKMLEHITCTTIKMVACQYIRISEH